MKKLLSIYTIMVVMFAASAASANNIASSTMHFEGALTDAGGGVYTGTILMTEGEYYVLGGPGEGIHTSGGFDVYAKEDGCAYVQGYYGLGYWNCNGNDTYLLGSDHDAYPEGGPWGSWYDPDCADWNQYELQLTADHWYLRYTPTGESPMSGVMNWASMYAAETDLGTQDGSHDGSAAHGGGARAWDWDCGWGVEAIPLELSGLKVEITPLGGGTYHVVLTPEEVFEVSQPVQVTSNEYYERGEAIVYDGSDYWLFYGRSANVTGNYQNDNPDVHDYAIYYKKSTSVEGLVTATPTDVPGAENCYIGEIGAAVVDGKVWTFAALPSTTYPGWRSLYGWYTTDGSSWTQVADLADNMPDGAAHHDEVGFDGKLYAMVNYPDCLSGWHTKYTDDPTATPITWSSYVPLNSVSNLINGTGHFFVDGSDLYIGVLRTSPTKDNKILEYQSSPEAWNEIATAESTGWDPTLFKVDSRYVLAQAPWVGAENRQYVIAWSSDVLESDFFHGGPMMVSEGKYGTETWVDMWPIGFTDDDGDSYLFYTSERKPGAPGTEITGNIWYLKVDWNLDNNHYTYIQEAIDASTGTTINIAAGTYTEQILIDKELTLLGATAGVNKNGYTVPTDYVWDDTVESIINHPDPSGGYTAIVDIYDVDNVTFDGFVVQELNAVGNLNASLIRVYAYTREISNINVVNNVIGPNTNTTAQDGAQGRMGLYIVNHPYDDKGVVNSTFAGNKIFDCKGNGNNLFLWTSYHAYGAPGPASMAGTVIEDNEIYGSHRSGIETAGGFSDLTIRNNTIYGNSGLPTDDPDKLKYGHGILLIRGSSDKVSDPLTAYGPVNLTIESNEIYGNEKSGIYMGPKNESITFTNNIIRDNGWDGIMLDLVGNYWNPTFEDPPASGQYACYDCSNNVVASGNGIYDNGTAGNPIAHYAVQVNGVPTNSFVLDASGNWWGDASGPYDGTGTNEVPPCTGDPTTEINSDGTGNEVSENVDYCPWLIAPDPDIDDDGICNPYAIDPSCTGFDNCPYTPNGPDLGTCVKIVGGVLIGTGVTCTSSGDCEDDELCGMYQMDLNGNTIGDACECYADFDGDGYVYPSDLSVFLSEYGRTDCLTNPPCETDIDGDGNVYPSDLSVFLEEYGREDCPTLP